jgi:SlyX protein
MQDRLMELEIKMAHMEDFLNVLNDALIKQQAYIEKLDSRLEVLKNRLQAEADMRIDTDPAAEKPPHY